MADAKPRNGRRWALGFGALALMWLLGVWPPPLWWRDHWPRETAMMRLRQGERWNDGKLGRSIVQTFHPIALGDIGPLLQRMVIIGEDSRFRTHHGIDPAEIADALGIDRRAGFRQTARTMWRQRDRLRGASTITQQLAKNLYLSPSRNPFRKLKEAVTAVRLEFVLPKDRILELYLNLVEWGPGIWGADAASRAYFNVPASRLDDVQAAALAATLPHPRSSNPTYRPERMTARRNLILARDHGVDVAIPPDEDLDTLPEVPPITPPMIPAALESLTIRVPTPVDTPRDTSRKP